MKKNPAEMLLHDVLENGTFGQGGGPYDGEPIALAELEQLLLNFSKEGFSSSGRSFCELFYEHTPGRPLEPALANRLYLMDLLSEQIRVNSFLDEAVQGLFFTLQPMLIRIMLRGDDFIKSSKHPLRPVLDSLALWGLGWQDGLGKGGEKLFEQLSELTEALESFTPARTLLPPSVEAAQEKLSKSFDRFQLLESRVCESEQGAMESLRSRRFVDKYLNGQLEGRELPEQVTSFLHNEWRNSLQMELQTHGKESRAWEQMTSLTGNLIKTFLPSVSEQEKQALYKLIPSMRGPLKKHLVSLHDNQSKDMLLDDIEALHMQILKGEQLPLEPVPPLSVLDTQGVVTSVTAALSEEAAKLQPGQWVLYRHEDGELQRVKLALLSSETGQMLFVNTLGAKCMEKNIEELAYGLTSKKVRLLERDRPFSKWLVKSIEKLIREHNARKKQQAEKPATEEAETQVRREQNKQMSIDKVRQEVADLRDQLQQTAKDSAPAEEQDVSLPEGERQEMAEAIAKLEIGAWVSMDNRLGERVPCKIAVIFASSGKMVFVDKSGLKIGEFLQEDLLEKIMKGEASILEQGANFENSLAKVIQSLRKD